MHVCRYIYIYYLYFFQYIEYRRIPKLPPGRTPPLPEFFSTWIKTQTASTRLNVASHPIYKNGLDSLFRVRGLHDTLGELRELRTDSGRSWCWWVSDSGKLRWQWKFLRYHRNMVDFYNCHATMLRSVVSFKLKTNSSFHNPGVDQI